MRSSLLLTLGRSSMHMRMMSLLCLLLIMLVDVTIIVNVVRGGMDLASYSLTHEYLLYFRYYNLLGP